MKADPGYFGPNSMMWKVNKEITVLFGGARALLMHAAHPLIAAGARQTSFYQRDPWKRLIRTLSLQNSVTFGTINEANESATRINKLHEVIKDFDIGFVGSAAAAEFIQQISMFKNSQIHKTLVTHARDGLEVS